MLDSEDRETGWEAAEALGEIKDDRVIPRFINDLKSGEPDIRERGIAALSRTRDSQAMDQILEMLKDREAAVRSRAAHVFSDYKDEKPWSR